MAGNSARLTITAFMDDRISGPMKTVGKEAQKMSEGFQRSSAALNLIGNAASEAGGKVGGFIGKAAGLVAMAGSSGPFGAALAAVTAGLAAWSFGLEKLLGPIGEAKTSTDELNEQIDDQDKKIKPLIDQHNELAKALQKTAEAQRDVEAEFRSGFDASMGMSARLRQMHESEAKRLADSAVAQRKAEDMADERRREMARGRVEHVNNVIDFEKRRNEKAINDQMAAEREAYEEKIRLQEQAASLIGDAIAQVVAASISGSEEQKRAAVAAAVTQIAASLAKGAAEAIAAHAGIPFVGPALGAVAAAAIVALITQFRGGFAHGGTVEGGVPGRDSVPIMAQQGEVVIPVGLAAPLRSVLNSRGPRSSSGHAYATGGTVSASSSTSAPMGGVTLVQNNTIPASDLQTRRAAKALAKEMRKMSRRGMRV